MTTLIISNEEINDMMKIIKTLEDSRVLLNGVTKTIENEAKQQKVKVGFLGMLLSTLDASLLGKDIVRTGFDNKSFMVLK